MSEQPFDPVAAWRILRDHLNTYLLADLCYRLGLRVRRTEAGDRGPMVCPRYECRSTEITFGGAAWACLACGAMGGAAAIFAAHVAGWEGEDGDDDAQVRADFERMAHWALVDGLVPSSGPANELFDRIPGLDTWPPTRPGIWEGEERGRRLANLGALLARAKAPFDSVLRVLRDVNAARCRPPLRSDEFSDVCKRLVGVLAA